MATSQQQWRHGRQQLLVVAVALALVLFVGSADAWQVAAKATRAATPAHRPKPGCETCIDNDPTTAASCASTASALYVPRCPPGYGDCDGKPWNKCETDLRHVIYNCNKCGHKCPCNLKWASPPATGAIVHSSACMHGWNYDNVKDCCVNKW